VRSNDQMILQVLPRSASLSAVSPLQVHHSTKLISRMQPPAIWILLSREFSDPITSPLEAPGIFVTPLSGSISPPQARIYLMHCVRAATVRACLRCWSIPYPCIAVVGAILGRVVQLQRRHSYHAAVSSPSIWTMPNMQGAVCRFSSRRTDTNEYFSHDFKWTAARYLFQNLRILLRGLLESW